MTAQSITLPEGSTKIGHAAFTGPSGQIDIVLWQDSAGQKHLSQISAGKNATIRSGDSAQVNYDAVISKAPGIVIF